MSEIIIPLLLCFLSFQLFLITVELGRIRKALTPSSPKAEVRFL
jgi:hypothetical protein